jgi:hypothetical protein
MGSSLAQMYKLAEQSTLSEQRKRRIQKEAAELQLKTLESQQNYERISYELQVQQKELALERANIEQQIALIKAQSDLKVAEADAQIVMADQTKTQLEKEAAQARVEAQKATLFGIERQGELLEKQATIERSTRGLERFQFERGQRDDLLNAQNAVAQTTVGQADDRKIGRQALAFAREDAENLPGIIDSLSRNLSQLANKSQIGQGSVESSLADAGSSRKDKITALEGALKLDLNLNVSGDTSNIDKDELNKTINRSTADGLKEIFTEIRNRSRSSF